MVHKHHAKKGPKAMTNIPATTETALNSTAFAMLVPLGIPQEEVQAGVQALINRISKKCGIEHEAFDRMLSMKEAAQRLNRSTKTIHSLVVRGKLKAVHCGAGAKRASGISERSIAAFLSGKEVAA